MSFNPKLTSIGVDGFKSIKNLQSLSLNRVNIFIGANGAGKSNFVALFLLLRAMANGRFQEFVGRAGGAGNLLYYGGKVDPTMWITLQFELKTGPGQHYSLLASTATA